ncbi:MAG: murein biosynthesis integral membrane protein MurJ [Kiritimatiellia bacterium]
MAGVGGILKNTVWVGALTALSRVLGLVREMLQSRLIGAGMAQSAFTLAFAIPNMARKLFGEGALTAAFVPVFRGEVESESLSKAAKLARAVMTMALLMLGAIVLLCMGGLELVNRFRDELGLHDMERLRLTIRLVKTLLPYMIFICGAAFGMGVLHSLGRFKAAGFMPSILNICWIGMLAWICLWPEMRLDQRIHRVAVAILAAGALQMAFLFWQMARAGVSPIPTFAGWRDAKVRLVWHNVGIAAVGAGAIQINYMLDQFLAQVSSEWAAGVIGYAERLMDLPLGIIGVAFGTVLLPTFAGLFAKKDVAGAREVMTASVKSLMFVMIPAAVGLCVLAREITEVIYEGGGFDARATIRVSRALAVYALGLGFCGLQKSLVPWFQAQNDMKTPLKVSLITIVLNATLNVLAVFLLPVDWRHVGLAASTVFCAGVGCLLLAGFAHRRNGSVGLAACVRPLAKMCAVAVVMGLVICALRPPLVAALAVLPQTPARLVALSVLIAAGAVTYALLALLLMPDLLKGILHRRR